MSGPVRLGPSNTVARLMERMLTSAMHDGEPSADDVANRLELAARLLLR